MPLPLTSQVCTWYQQSVGLQVNREAQQPRGDPTPCLSLCKLASPPRMLVFMSVLVFMSISSS